MIPNTFDGFSAEIKDLPKTTIQLAYFTRQKLRDHSDAHDVIAFDNWNENDDSAVNKSLTKTLVGLDNELACLVERIKSHVKTCPQSLPPIFANLYHQS